MGRRSAKKAEKSAKREQEAQLAESQRLADEAEAEQAAEQKRIFEATKPADEVASIEFGIQGRDDAQTYSSFDDGFDYSFGGSGDFNLNPKRVGQKVKAKEEEKNPIARIVDTVKQTNPWFNKMYLGY